jgi:hypothetical protein
MMCFMRLNALPSAKIREHLSSYNLLNFKQMKKYFLEEWRLLQSQC